MLETPKPQLQRLFEAAIVCMGVERRRERLELVFEHGRLESWSLAGVRSPAAELGKFDEQASWIVKTRSAQEIADELLKQARAARLKPA
jgi:hypothetical protein